MRRRPKDYVLLARQYLPGWVWLTLAVMMVAPWYLAYVALVLRLAGVVSFWMPAS